MNKPETIIAPIIMFTTAGKLRIEGAPYELPIVEVEGERFVRMSSITNLVKEFNLGFFNDEKGQCRKIPTIKRLKELTGLDLYQAKNFVDNLIYWKEKYENINSTGK